MTCNSTLNRSGMRLLDLVEQQHAVRVLIDAIGKQATLVETDIARGGADQARNSVPLHVFRHIEAYEFDAERRSQLLRNFCLSNARWT